MIAIFFFFLVGYCTKNKNPFLKYFTVITVSLHPSHPYCFLITHSLSQWLMRDTEGVALGPGRPAESSSAGLESRASGAAELQDDFHAVVSADDPDLAGSHLRQAGRLEGEQHGTLAEVHVEPAGRTWLNYI